MRKYFIQILISFLVVLSFNGCVTPPQPTSEIVQKVYDFPEVKGETLFVKSQLWASNTFVSAKDAIELTNQNAGLITIRTTYDSHAYEFGKFLGGQYYTTYKIVIEVKDGKARITCQNQTYEVILKNGRPEPMAGSLKKFDEEFLLHANVIVKDYYEYLNKDINW